MQSVIITAFKSGIEIKSFLEIKHLYLYIKAASSIKWNISFYKAQKKMWLILHFTHVTHHIFPYFAAEYFWMCPPRQWREECEVPLLNEGFSTMNSSPNVNVFSKCIFHTHTFRTDLIWCDFFSIAVFNLLWGSSACCCTNTGGK